MAACYKSRLTLSKRVESNKRKVRQVRRNQEAKSLPPLYVLLLRYVIHCSLGLVLKKIENNKIFQKVTLGCQKSNSSSQKILLAIFVIVEGGRIQFNTITRLTQQYQIITEWSANNLSESYIISNQRRFVTASRLTGCIIYCAMYRV